MGGCFSCRPKMVEIAILTLNKSSGTAGGGSTGGTWNPRVLTNLGGNFTQNWCSLNTITGEVTLKGGAKYLLRASSVGVGVGSHQLRLKNVTDNTYSYGLSALSYALTPGSSSNADIEVYLNISANKTFALEHYTEKSVPNFGLGFPVGDTGNTEVYANVVIQKL